MSCVAAGGSAGSAGETSGQTYASVGEEIWPGPNGESDLFTSESSVQFGLKAVSWWVVLPNRPQCGIVCDENLNDP